MSRIVAYSSLIYGRGVYRGGGRSLPPSPSGSLPTSKKDMFIKKINYTKGGGGIKKSPFARNNFKFK